MWIIIIMNTQTMKISNASRLNPLKDESEIKQVLLNLMEVRDLTLDDLVDESFRVQDKGDKFYVTEDEGFYITQVSKGLLDDGITNNGITH